MKINREEFLKQLESVLLGMSSKGGLEQSSCFVFMGKTVCTFNDEIACAQESLLNINGAVPAMPFINILRKMKEEEVSIDIGKEESEILIKGKRRRAGINLEAKVTLPVDDVEEPTKWKKLPADFAEGVSMVIPCAGANTEPFNMTCVHLTKEYVEAWDNYQVARYKIPMNIKTDTLIRAESLKQVLALDVTEFSETEHWIHFRNASTGLVVSCRYWMEDYPELDDLFKTKGQKLELPKGLADAIEKAEVFSSENVEGSLVTVSVSTNKLKIRGKGVSGWFTETKDIKYDGRDLEFTIPSELLRYVVSHFNKCQASNSRLRVRSGKFNYITVLGVVDEKKEEDD